jgi:hypothetical protein
VCPACISNAVMTVAGAASLGGFAMLTVRVIRPRADRKQPAERYEDKASATVPGDSSSAGRGGSAE